MTSVLHTPITLGAAANAATINAPLSELDTYVSAHQTELATARAAYTTLNGRLDALTLAGGNAATLTNGVTSAGQKIIVIDSSTGFLAGATVAYTLVGGAVETNGIATVDSPTQITCTTNVGTGGIGDNTYISIVPLGSILATGVIPAATSQKQTFTKGAFVGALTPSGDDNGIAVGRAATNPLSAGGSHAFRDESTYTFAGTGGYASYDAIPVVTSDIATNHIAAFQARPAYGGAGLLDTLQAFTCYPTIDGPASNVYGLHVYDAGGTGAINIQAALWCDHLTRGTSNFVIFSDNTTPSYHGGIFQTGTDVIVGGAVRATNFYTHDAQNQTSFGFGTPGASQVGYYLTAVGWHAGATITSGVATFDTFIGSSAGIAVTTGSRNTFVGSYAGYQVTTGDGNVFLGHKAGWGETDGSNKLCVANGDTATPIIYGLMDNTTWGNQEIKFNVGKMGFFGHAAAAQPTKAGHNNWAALSDVVSALVAIGILDTA